MGQTPPDEEAIFKIASSIPAGETRQAYLVQACGDDPALMDRLLALLKAHDEEASFLEQPQIDLDETVAQETTPTTSDSVIGPYKILQEIAEGGMGVVYMAEQSQPVKRRVALKVIKPGMDSRQVIARFEAERQALAMMDHPSIARVLDAGTTDSGRPFFVMELVKGIPITQYCDDHHLSTRERLKLFSIVCNAIQHAHQKGVIHRDLKPSNILVAEYDDQAVPKIIDFGLAKALHSTLTDKTMFTQFGQIVGTIDYMSPEQAKFNQLDVDTRSDIYSLGVLLYELMTGTTPFDRQRLRSTSFEELMRIIGEEEPPRPSTRLNTSTTLPALAASRGTDARKLAGLVKGELDWIVMRALEKDRSRRYQTASDFASDVERYLTDQPVDACPPSVTYRARKFVRRHKATLTRAVAALLIVAMTAAAAMFGWKYFYSEQQRVAQQSESERQQNTLAQQRQREQRARQEQIPKIRELIDEKKIFEAFELAREVDAVLPEDPLVNELRSEFAFDWQIKTYPEGVDVYWRVYDDPKHKWQYVGRTPIESTTLPNELLLWKLSREGFEEVIGCRHPTDGIAAFTLHKRGEVPLGMVHVSGNAFPNDVSGAGFYKLELEDFFIDRCEVTNRQFQEFVDQGGYQNRDYWEQNFLKDDQSLNWEEAMSLLVDQTGQPGPSTWQNGRYPEGEAEYPVGGVSWYEAAAYARFAGKELPSVAHWIRASGNSRSHAVPIINASNLSSELPTSVGTLPGIGPFGTLDTAGNVREWCQNATESGFRALLGGGCNDPLYQFTLWNASDPLSRDATNGFRCAKYRSTGVQPEALAVVKRRKQRNLLSAQPISDEMFEICRVQYLYRKDKLNATVVASEEVDGIRHEVATIDTAYGQERFDVHVFRPAQISGPYQPILYFPTKYFFKNEEPFPKNWRGGVGGVINNGLIESGRAIVWPIYSESFQRSTPNVRLASGEWAIRVVQDAMRAVDYLETRSDMDMRRLGFLGGSMGGMMGPYITGIDSRIKTGIFLAGGMMDRRTLPPFDPVNLASQTRCPVLMINGRDDQTFPVATSQRPLYQFLGSRPDEKAWMIFDSGHGVNQKLWRPDALAWYDLHLGPLEANVEQRQLKATANFAVIRGDWTSAADAMVKALDADADSKVEPELESIDWMRTAVLLLLAEDLGGYLKHCTAMAEKFADLENPAVWERVVKSCSLDPSAANLVSEALEKLSGSLAAATSEGDLRDWSRVTLALAAHRRGDAKKSLALVADFHHSRLDESLPSLACLAHAVAALSHQELGHTELAQTQLAAATELIDETLPRREDGTVNPSFLMRTQQIRHDWLIAETMRTQAEHRILQRGLDSHDE